MEKLFQIQQAIYQPIIGELNFADSGMAKISRDLQSGQLPRGKNLGQLEQSTNRRKWQELLGRFAPAVILATDPQTSLIPEQLVIAGGWCALRTCEVNNLQQGLIVNPETALPEKITSAGQVANWIQQAVSFDQVTEAIAPLNQGEMMAISEVKLWSQRICQKLNNILGQSLSSGEKERIFDAVETADQTRFKLTQRYITYVTNSPRGQSLKRLPDYQIWRELTTARDELLLLGELSLNKLARMYNASPALLEPLSLVWAMYSEPYFRNLRQSGLINGHVYLIAEPAEHAQATSATEAYFINKIYQDLGVYFERYGINHKTGYAAFIGCLDSRGQNARRSLNLGSIPNLANWQQLLSQGTLTAENNLTLNLRENQLLLWGLNLMPFDEAVQQAIISLANLRAQFVAAKKQINSNSSQNNGIAKTKVDQLRYRLEPEIFIANQLIAKQLYNFFNYLNQ